MSIKGNVPSRLFWQNSLRGGSAKSECTAMATVWNVKAPAFFHGCQMSRQSSEPPSTHPRFSRCQTISHGTYCLSKAHGQLTIDDLAKPPLILRLCLSSGLGFLAFARRVSRCGFGLCFGLGGSLRVRLRFHRLANTPWQAQNDDKCVQNLKISESPKLNCREDFGAASTGSLT